MGPALRHHYDNSRHHPEHFYDGIKSMDLIDLLEMLADWHAAGFRHADGSLAKSLAINKERFGISDELLGLLERTAKNRGWV